MEQAANLMSGSCIQEEEEEGEEEEDIRLFSLKLTTEMCQQ